MNGESPRRKAAFWLSAMFLLGAALGVVLEYAYAHCRYAATSSMTEQARHTKKVEELTRQLALTTEQRQKLDTVLGEIQGQIKTIHRQSEPQIDAIRQKGRNEIRSFLTTEQKPKFEEFIRKLDEERKRNWQ